MTNYLFLHAHPDDEAIFTGGIINKLVSDGNNVHVVFATGGELGNNVETTEKIENIRRSESEKAAEILGVNSIEFLGYHDSGLDIEDFPPNAFAACETDEAVQKLNNIIEDKNIDVLFCDDEFGIYGHPDHLKAHEVGQAAASNPKIKELYFTTVDREYLHFVEIHLVEEAIVARNVASTLGLARNTLGMSSVEISHTIKIKDVLDTKRKAMAAHSSQIDDTSSALVLDDEQFEAVYGHEWFVREADSSSDNSLLKYCI